MQIFKDIFACYFFDMAAILLFILLCIGLYFFYLYLKKDMAKTDHYMEIADCLQDKELDHDYIATHYKEHPADHIRKFFKANPDKLAIGERLLKEKSERQHLNLESWKKSFILDRIFAYDYEDLLFRVFSSVAETDSRGKWVSLTHINKDIMLQYITDINNINYDEAQKIITLLEKHGILISICDGYLLSPLLQDMDDKKTMTSWNIVSDTDMNLDKWMVAHGYERKRK